MTVMGTFYLLSVTPQVKCPSNSTEFHIIKKSPDVCCITAVVQHSALSILYHYPWAEIRPQILQKQQIWNPKQ